METLRHAVPGGDAAGRVTAAPWELVVLPSEDKSAPDARTRAAAAMSAWGVTAPGADLVVSELVSNAVRAARDVSSTRIVLRLSCASGALLVEAGDASPDPPAAGRPQDPGAEHGRGMLIVEALSAEYGWYRAGSWKIVWALLPAELERCADVAERAA